MANFPGKWYDFNNHKQIKKIREDLNNTLSLRLQISTSIVVAIISFILGDYVKSLEWYFKVLICVGLSLIVIGVLFYPYIAKKITDRTQSNIIINGKNAISLFDDEIVYDVLVACEYYENRNQIPASDLSYELRNFYDIEMEYYVKSAVEKLVLFLPNYSEVFGNGKKQIGFDRFDNIKKLIDTLIEKVPINLPKELGRQYDSLSSRLVKLKPLKN